MKRALLALPLTLLMGVSATSALAANVGSGTINFNGAITSTTCPIQIIDPVTGSPTGSHVTIGVVSAGEFTAAGQEVGNARFGLRLTPGGGCTVNPGEVANVTFTGTKDTTGNYFRFMPVDSPAGGVVAALRDDQGAPVYNGQPSRDFELDDTLPTDMIFHVAHRSESATVTPGGTKADVRFSVAIN